ncbi:hypothetical protein [Flavobacterium sp. 123]|uniref:hypothetical protein n=1 Tax=Flavobacterium sp. 123 TaxID=2135627 RepID=UPI000F247B24|nr:hypothetical protein [Flavobacterium sp. 123]RKS99661.1 hypothetical protein C8C88_1456 [Flavobacterium sp. 123]
MKSHFLTFIIKYKFIAIALFYMFFSLIIGETHPFSCFPMYSSFPNWSYAFYLADENDKLIPAEQFQTTGGKMGHTYYSVCSSKKILYGNGMESDKELQTIGKEMMDLIALNNKSAKYSNIALHRIYFFYQNDTIKQQNKIIYERNFE